MKIDELINYLQYDATHIAIVTKRKEYVVHPIFIFAPVDRLLSDMDKEPAILKNIDKFDEQHPIYIVVQDGQIEQLYTNCLRTWNVVGFVNVVNVGTKGLKSAIMNSLLHSNIDLQTCTFTELELPYGEWNDEELEEFHKKLIPSYVVAYSYSESEDHSARGVRLNFNLPSATVHWNIARLKEQMTYRTVLPFFESGFYVQLLYWLAEHGMDFMVTCEPSKHNKLCTHYDRIYADDLFKLRRTTPNLFTRGGAIDVHYIHELATETRALIY